MIWYGSSWWFKLWHSHSFKLYRIDFEGPFVYPQTRQANISFCETCRVMKVEEYDNKGTRILVTRV